MFKFFRNSLPTAGLVAFLTASSLTVFPISTAASPAINSSNCSSIKASLTGGTVQGNALTLNSLVNTLADSNASFKNPFAITTDRTSLYVADRSNNTIRKIAIASGLVTTLAGTADHSGATDGAGAAGAFDSPAGITTDGVNLYVTDSGNNTVRKIDILSGHVSTLAGTAGVYGNVDAIGSEARFDSPSGITTDDGTHLFLADTLNHSIRKIVIATGAVTTLAGGSESGSVDGEGAAARFDQPSGITTDGVNLYVTDKRNHSVRKIVIATGAVTTLAGVNSVRGRADGNGVTASFSFPEGITTDGTNLYVADSDNNAIRKIVISTNVVTTLVGGLGVYGNPDDANLNYPAGITTDGSSLFVADTANNLIRKIQ